MSELDYDYRIVEFQSAIKGRVSWEVCKVTYAPDSSPLMYWNLRHLNFDSEEEIRLLCEAGTKPMLIHDELKSSGTLVERVETKEVKQDTKKTKEPQVPDEEAVIAAKEVLLNPDNYQERIYSKWVLEFCGVIKQQDELIMKFRKDVFLSPKEVCQKYNIQDCNVCEDIECVDNTSPAKKKIMELMKTIESKG